MYRIVLGVCVVIALSVRTADSTGWLDLPRAARNILHVLPFLVGLGLSIGAFRRWFSVAAAALAIALTALGYSAWQVTGIVLAHCGLVAAIPKGEPWAAFADTERLPAAAHWYPAAWAVALCSAWLSIASNNDSALAIALGVVVTLLVVAIAALGPTKVLAPACLIAVLLLGLLGGHGTSSTALWLPLALACVSLDWLPGRTPQGEPPVVFFDGECGMCDGGMQLIVAEDLRGMLKLAPLQGEASQRLLHRLPDAALETMIILDAGHQYARSDGALRIAEYLGGIWRLVTPISVLPNTLRDAIYDWVAKNRYSWFGKLEACRIPTPSERTRYLE